MQHAVAAQGGPQRGEEQEQHGRRGAEQADAVAGDEVVPGDVMPGVKGPKRASRNRSSTGWWFCGSVQPWMFAWRAAASSGFMSSRAIRTALVMSSGKSPTRANGHSG